MRPVRVDLGIIEGQVHELDATHVRGAVLGEAAGDIGTRGVDARKHIVGAARTVDVASIADVVDGAVDGKVDWLLLVLSVVGS